MAEREESIAYCRSLFYLIFYHDPEFLYHCCRPIEESLNSPFSQSKHPQENPARFTHYFVVNVVSTFDTDIDYFVNASTYRLERSRTRRPLHPTQDPTPILIEERWSDFRMVGDVLHPIGYSQWNVDTGARLSWLEVQRIEQFAEATAEFFGKPE